MANANAPIGMVPRRYRNGSPWMGATRTYYRPASDTAALYPGDPVVIVAGSDTMGHASVVKATAGAGNRITGVYIGRRPSAPFVDMRVLPASTADYVLVADDPALLFEIQESAATDGAALTAAAMGKNANLLLNAGNVYGSGAVLDSTSASTTATGQVRIVESQKRIDNSLIGAAGTPGAAYGKWLVAINQPTETGAAGSLGV